MGPLHTRQKKYGAYVIEYEGAIVLVCTEDLCAILKETNRQAQTVTFQDLVSSSVTLANYTVEIPLLQTCVQTGRVRVQRSCNGQVLRLWRNTADMLSRRTVLFFSLVTRNCLRKLAVLKVSLTCCIMAPRMHRRNGMTSRDICDHSC